MFAGKKWGKKDLSEKNREVNKHIESNWRKTSAVVLALWRKGECISETHSILSKITHPRATWWGGRGV